jgi:predicted nuclease of predicted toxin-antitoxin system
MKLLLDQNVSPKLVARLFDVFPGSSHVQQAALDTSSDDQVWQYAIANGFVIVTKDEDFHLLNVLRGSPPKVIWLQMGNCTTAQIEATLRNHLQEIEDFGTDPAAGTLVLR